MDYKSVFLCVDFDMDRASMIENYGTSPTHAMIFQGAGARDGKAKQWRIENSCGRTPVRTATLIMSADWFRLYGEADVRRQYVPEDLLKVWTRGRRCNQIGSLENLGYPWWP